MLDILAGLTVEHILLADMMTDTAIRLIKASRPENLREYTKEEANALIEELGAKRELLLNRLKNH